MVIFITISNSTGGFGGLLQNQTGAVSFTNYYQLFDQPQLLLRQLTAYTVTGTINGQLWIDQEQSIWIDYNQDNVFQNSEQVGQFNSIPGSATLRTFNVNIPLPVLLMVRLAHACDGMTYTGPTPVMDPCSRG